MFLRLALQTIYADREVIYISQVFSTFKNQDFHKYIT